MKKFVSYLALTAFALASHMSTVHAWDMFGMEMDGGRQMKAEHSIFCSDASTQTNGSDCAKQSIPEKAIATSRSFDIPEPKTGTATFIAFVVKSDSETFESVANLATPPPFWAWHETNGGDGYVSRIGGDVRKLD